MSVSDAPLFSIVIVSLNACEYIAEALDSVLAQDEPSYEVLVVDGASIDGTVEIVRWFEDRFGGRLRLTSEPDEGLYDAMNKGLRAASGRYIAYLGADDRLSPGALSAVAEAARSAGWPEIIAGATRVTGAAREWTEPARSFSGERLAKRAPARHQSMFVLRTAVTGAGGFKTVYRIAADYDLYLRLLEAGADEVLIDDVLSQFRLGGVSSANASRTAGEYRDVRIAHGANAIWQQLVTGKSIAAAMLVGALRGVGRANRGQ